MESETRGSMTVFYIHAIRGLQSARYLISGTFTINTDHHILVNCSAIHVDHDDSRNSSFGSVLYWLCTSGKTTFGESKTRLRAIFEIIVNFHTSPPMIFHPMGLLQPESCLINSPI